MSLASHSIVCQVKRTFCWTKSPRDFLDLAALEKRKGTSDACFLAASATCRMAAERSYRNNQVACQGAPDARPVYPCVDSMLDSVHIL